MAGIRPRSITEHVRNNWALLLLAATFFLYFLATRNSGSIEPDIDYRAEAKVSQAWPNAKKKVVLLTGGAGFIGSHTAQVLLGRGDDVIIVDEVNDYYDISIKEENIAALEKTSRAKNSGRLTVHRFDIADRAKMKAVFEEAAEAGTPITHICHLAARAGVRYSIANPDVYIHSNVQGTLVMLDMARDFKVFNFVFASSSSVYGENTKVPFTETDRVDGPVSPYAATKRSCELLALTYNHLYGIPMAALRFFTVYGPRGRPDMAPFKFIEAISRGKPIDVYGDGSTSRDYTFVSDTVKGIVAALDKPFLNMQIINLGNSRPATLSHFIEVVERAVGKKAIINRKPPQPGDVPITYADPRKARTLLNYWPAVELEDGIQRMADWYRAKYGDHDQ